MTRDRKFARAGQTHKEWEADSASMEHAPQVGLGSSPILWRELFRQCPVISETKIVSLLLDKFSNYLVTLNLGCEIHCLDCRQPETSAQLREYAWIGHSFVFCRTTEVDSGRHGSGPQKVNPDPSLASSSALSFRKISLCV
jgi:hypothetical protein